MGNNPDAYLLYEYMKKNAFTVRLKAVLSEAVDEALLTQAAREAMTRFPYFSVRVELDEKENYVYCPTTTRSLSCLRRTAGWCLALTK